MQDLTTTNMTLTGGHCAIDGLDNWQTKQQEWKLVDQVAGVEIDGLDIDEESNL